jgi:hypothetical protein
MAVIETPASHFQRLRVTSATDTSFASKVPTTTEPTGAGVVDLTINPLVGRQLLLVFFGAGNDDTTFDARVIGWRKVGTLWVPCPLATLSCTLSSAVGVAGAEVVATDRFVDTVTAGFGNEDDKVWLFSPTSNLIARVLLDLDGFPKVEVIFDLTGATSANCLYTML